MSTRPTKSEISIWRDFLGSADSSSSSVRMTYSPPPRSKPLHDPVLRDLLAGPLVDLLVADPVRRPLLELVEVDALVRRGRVQADGDVHQSETEGPLPDRAWHVQQNTSPEQVHHLVTAIRHTESMVKDAPTGFGPALLGGLAELGPVEPFSGDLSLELGISVWLRTSGTSLIEARSSLLEIRRVILEVCGLDPATEPVPAGRPLPQVRRREPGRLHLRAAPPGVGGTGSRRGRRSSRPSWPSCPCPRTRRSGPVGVLEAEGGDDLAVEAGGRHAPQVRRVAVGEDVAPARRRPSSPCRRPWGRSTWPG